MIHILCRKCKSWIPRKQGKTGYSYEVFEKRIKNRVRQIKCFCGRWTYNPQNAKFHGTKEQIEQIQNKK